MRKLAVLLVALTLIAPASVALAQVGAAAGGPAGGGGGGGAGNAVYDSCDPSDIGPGFRATLDQISQAKDATINPLSECEELNVALRFGVGGQSHAITENKKLFAYLRHQGIAPWQVVGVQFRRGKIIVHVDI